MNPILKTLDILQVIPYNGRKIRAGDVIVFLPPNSDHKITHRVISVDSQGIRTQGDNNNDIDLWILSPNHILGRVVYIQRGNKQLRIYGGLIGRLFVAAIRTVRAIKSGRAVRIVKSGIFSLLRPPYHQLVQSGIFRQWLPAGLKTRVLSFDRPAGTELQLLMGGRVIGRRLPGKDHWQIRRPFRLFIDETSLPVEDPDPPN